MKQYWKTPIQTTYDHVNTTTSSLPSQIANSMARYTHIKPRQPAPRLPERSLVLPTRTLLQTKHTPEPILRLHRPEEDLLLVQIRRDIVAQQREKARDGERLVAIPQDLVVDRVLIVQIAQEADSAVYGDHKQDADDVFLLKGFQVAGRMLED